MKMTIQKIISLFSFAVLLISVCGKSYADIESDVSLDFPGTTASGGCILSISELELVRYINSDCVTAEMDGEQTVRQDSNPISNFDIGSHPRSEPFDKTWQTFLFNIEPGEQYCQDFGNAEDKILFFDNQGEPGGPFGTGFWPGAETCDNVPTPPTNLVINWGGFSCHTCDCTDWELSHSATNASSYSLLHSASSSGPWTVYNTVTYTNNSTHTGTNGRWYKIKASNSAGSIYGSATFKFSHCDYCEGGGEEP